jgi:hypothetical protein
LIPPFPGSNPGAPATKSSLWIYLGCCREEAGERGAFKFGLAHHDFVN